MRRVAAMGVRAVGVVVVVVATGLALTGLAGASSLSPSGSATNLTINATDNIYGAGLNVAPDPGGNGGGQVPLDVPIPSGTTWITVSKVAGTVQNAASSAASNGADGRAGSTAIDPTGSISGIDDSTSLFFLTGVFLNGPQPGVATTPPATLDFTGDHSFSSFSPELDQVFFVGDGLTGTGTGDEQYFQVPSGATDLYLGFADSTGFQGPAGTYNDNSGSLSANVNFFTGQYVAPSSSSTLTTASSTAVTINATDNVFGAGLTTPPAPAGDGAGTPPLDVPIPSGTTWISFSDVTGAVNSIPGDPNGPDGLDQATDVDSVGGISGIDDSTGAFFLTGVYYDRPQTGANATPPPYLNFSNDESFASLSPELDQLFFIGDGLTGTGTGSTQYFQVPSGATDLFLGFVDAYSFEGEPGTYSNDSGSLSANVNFLTGHYGATGTRAHGDRNIVNDGGFESPVVTSSFQTFTGGSTMGPWTVTGNSVDLVTSSYLAPHHGVQEVDLSGSNYHGSSAGGIYQDLATRPGERYTLTYWEGGNGTGPPTVKTLSVSFAGKSVGATTYTDGTSPTYVKYTFQVVATSSTSRLAFISPIKTAWGALLDDVSVVPAGASGVIGGGSGDVAPIAASIGTPNEVFHSFGHNLVNAVITVAAILFITFPSVVFNQTFTSNYDEIMLILANFRRRVRKAFGLKEEPASVDPLPTASKATAAPAAAAPAAADMPGHASRPWFYSVLVIGAILGGLLNPKFGFNSRSVADIGATLVAFALGTAIGWFISKWFRQHHKYPVHTYLHALPLGLGVAALCVIVSRLTNFEPGYLYGVIVSIAFVETLEERHNAHLTAISALSTLAVALIAWFLWVPVNHFALEHGGNILLAIVDDVLASVFIGGLVGTVIGLLPLEFMPGGTIAKWRKDVWAIVFFVAVFLLVEVELRPAAGPTHPGGAPIVTALVLFAIFGGGSFWMRHYFAQRKAAKGTEGSAVATSVVAPEATDTSADD